MNNFFSDVFNHYMMTGLLLLMAAAPDIMVATLPIIAPRSVELVLIKCTDSNTFTDRAFEIGDVVCYSV